ncbi:MAG: PIN domain-containing protein [Burkholderiales bacterium]|nr:PIN domain-containing protein [Burkholderiales bacterium]
MAVSARYTAALDACVLYPRLYRDVLLSLAQADLYTARWSVHIEAEWTPSLLKDRPGAAVQIERTVELMRDAVPDCLVTHYEDLIDSLTLPDPNDRHVLAAAIRGNADAIVTANVKDFPASVLSRFDVELQTPDHFVLNQMLLQPAPALAALKRMRERWNRPSVSAEAMVSLFEQRQLAQTAAHLRDVLELI